MVTAAQAGLSVGGKLWYVSFGDDAVDSALMIGPKADLSGENVWLSGMFLFGSTEAGGEDIDQQDGEVLVGLTLSLFDIGVGLRDTTWKEGLRVGGQTEDMTIWGPMAYVGMGNSFGDSPIGWYAGASYMFMDMGDLKDAQDDLKSMGINEDITGEHYNIEVGLSFSAEHFQATVGYRIKKFINYNNKEELGDATQSGLAASASFLF